MTGGGPPAAKRTPDPSSVNGGRAMNSVQSQDGTAIALRAIGTGPADHPGGRRDVLPRARMEPKAGKASGPAIHRRRLRPPRPRTERRHPAVRSRARDRGPPGADRRSRRVGIPVRPLLRWCARLETAAHHSGVRKLVLYEVPFNVDGPRPVNVEDYPAQLHNVLAADRRGDAVKLFLRQVGSPGPIIRLFPLLPM